MKKIFRISLFVLVWVACLPAQETWVFWPGVKSNEISSDLQGMGSVRVFGNINSFERELKNQSDVNVIAPGPFFQYRKEYSANLASQKGIQFKEKLLLVSLDASIQLPDLEGKKIGLWNQMGRKNAKKFIKENLGIEKARVKTVNKESDLISLIGLDVVSAILISEREYNAWKSKTELPLTVISDKEIYVDLPKVASKGKASINKRKIKRISDAVFRQLGKLNWREL